MIIIKYTFMGECEVLGEGNIDMLTKFYSLVRDYDSGDFIISKDHRPRFFAVEYASIKGNKPEFVLVLTDDVIDGKDIYKPN